MSKLWPKRKRRNKINEASPGTPEQKGKESPFESGSSVYRLSQQRSPMKPHYIGYRLVGYIDHGPYGTQMFHPNGEMYGVTYNRERAREGLRDTDAFVRKYDRDPGRYQRNLYT
jgi:hypothetical protein